MSRMRRFASVFLCALIFFSSGAYAGLGVWTSNGPEEAWPTSFAFDPSDALHIYMGTLGAGVFESTDGGLSWSSVSRGLPPSSFVGGIAIASATPLTIYAPVGAEIFRTTNGGINWTRRSTGLASGIGIVSVTAHPTNSLILLASTLVDSTPLYRTTNGGATWTTATTGLPTSRPISDVAADPLTPGRFAIALEAGIYVTTDSGATWSPVTDPLAGSGSFAADILFDTVTLDMIHLISSSGGGFRSTNAGASWSPTGFPLGPALASSPLAASRIYTGPERSTDNGLSYSPSATGQEVIPSMLSFAQIVTVAASPLDANLVFAGGRYSGVFRSTDGGATWSAANGGLKSSNNRAVAFDLTTAGTIYAAAGDGATNTRGFYRSTDNGLTWSASNTNLSTTSTRAVSSDPNRVGHVYAGGFPLEFGRQGVHKSIDSGTTWTTIDNGLPSVSTVRDIVIDPTPPAMPSDPAVLYLGASGGVFKSVDGGANWAVAGTGLPAFRTGPNNYIVINLVMAPSDPLVLYAAITPGTGGPAPLGGVYRTIDGGMNWTQANGSAASALPDASSFAVAVDPRNSSVVYAANSDTNGSGWIYKSLDGGMSWNPADTGLSVRDIRALLIDPASPDTVYAAVGGSSGNPGGVFQSRDGGATWNSISIGLLDTSATALALDPMDSNRLLAGTRLAVNEITLTPDADADGASDAAESAAPNAGDGNADLIADSAQDDVVSLPLNVSSKVGFDKGLTTPYLTASVEGCDEIFDAFLGTEQDTAEDEQYEYPNGLISFELPNCETATVTLIFNDVPEFAERASFRTFAPTQPGDASTLEWFDVAGAQKDGNEWTFELSDGELGDFRGDTGTIRFTGGIGELTDFIYGNSFE